MRGLCVFKQGQKGKKQQTCFAKLTQSSAFQQALILLLSLHCSKQLHWSSTSRPETHHASVPPASIRAQHHVGFTGHTPCLATLLYLLGSMGGWGQAPMGHPMHMRTWWCFYSGAGDSAGACCTRCQNTHNAGCSNKLVHSWHSFPTAEQYAPTGEFLFVHTAKNVCGYLVAHTTATTTTDQCWSLHSACKMGAG